MLTINCDPLIVSTPRHTILIATTNPGKLREIRQVAGDLTIEWRTLDDVGNFPEPIEDADTFEGNAEKKARHYCGLTGMWTLADDSGLEVDALNGAPGVHSARFAGGRDDQANNVKLVNMLRDVAPDRRTARFVCAMVLVSSKGMLATTRGVIEGVIIDQPLGANGFGYDPHFLVPDLGKTTAQLDPDHKNRISHRGQALRMMLARIEAIFASEDQDT